MAYHGYKFASSCIHSLNTSQPHWLIWLLHYWFCCLYGMADSGGNVYCDTYYFWKEISRKILPLECRTVVSIIWNTDADSYSCHAFWSRKLSQCKWIHLSRSTWKVLLQLYIYISNNLAVCGVDVQTFLQCQDKLKDDNEKWWWPSPHITRDTTKTALPIRMY